jgi:multicomponent Na+:H+ antiporter subunit G
MIELAITGLVTLGSFFLTVGTLGLLKLPDVYNRMHATTKATTMGASSMFLAAALYFGPGAGFTALVGIAFLFTTAPTGAHLISRAAQKTGVEFAGNATWPETSTEPVQKREMPEIKTHVTEEPETQKPASAP